MNSLYAFPLALLGVTVLEVLRWKVWQGRWASRELLFSSSRAWLLVRGIVAVVMGGSIALLWGLPLAAFSLGAFVWLGLTATETDLLGRRIPREPCWAVLGLGILGGAWSGSVAGAASFAAAFIVVGLVLLILAVATRGGLGSGDVRLALAMTPLAWWVGAMPLLYGLLLASAFQLIFRLVAHFAKRGSKLMPFGPSLFLGTTVAVLLWPPTSGGSCLEWLGLLPC